MEQPNIKLVRYEALVTRPDEAFLPLLPLLPPGFSLARALQGHGMPSSTNASWSPAAGFAARLDRWQDQLTLAQKEEAAALLGHFGFSSDGYRS